MRIAGVKIVALCLPLVVASPSVAEGSCPGPDYCFCHWQDGMNQVAFIGKITEIAGGSIQVEYEGGAVYCTNGEICTEDKIIESLRAYGECYDTHEEESLVDGVCYIFFVEVETGCVLASLEVENGKASCLDYRDVDVEQILSFGLLPMRECRKAWLEVAVERDWKCNDGGCGCGGYGRGLGCAFFLFVLYISWRIGGR